MTGQDVVIYFTEKVNLIMTLFLPLSVYPSRSMCCKLRLIFFCRVLVREKVMVFRVL